MAPSRYGDQRTKWAEVDRKYSLSRPSRTPENETRGEVVSLYLASRQCVHPYAAIPWTGSHATVAVRLLHIKSLFERVHLITPLPGGEVYGCKAVPVSY